MSKVVFALEDDISTDDIYPGRYMATVLPSETPQVAFADHAEFNAKLRRKEVPAGEWQRLIICRRKIGLLSFIL